MKKIFALILTICLMASALCIAALAAEPADGVALTVHGQKKDGTTVKIEDYKDLADGWSQAIKLAENDEKMAENGYVRIVVDLYTDWTAKDGSFGSGDGFSSGAIHFPSDTKITLNLNGHTLNRALGSWKWSGEVIYVDEDADAMIHNGTITGGNSGGGAGGIHIDDDAKVVLNDVHIVGNVSVEDDGGGIAIYDGASLIMNGGSFKNNSVAGSSSTSEHVMFAQSYYGGAIYVEDSTAEFNNVAFKNNQVTYESNYGAAIYANDSEIKISGCVFDGNGIENESQHIRAAYSVIHAKNSRLDISGTTFINNGAKREISSGIGYSAVIVLDNASLDMYRGETNNTFSHNNSYFLINDGDDSEIFVSDTDFLDNAASVLYGDNQTSSISYFKNCKFNNNAAEKMESFYDVNTTLTFYDCDMGNSNYQNAKSLLFVDSFNPDVPEEGSLIGKGSLPVIVAFLALAGSVAAIGISISSKQKKILAATNGAPASGTEE